MKYLKISIMLVVLTCQVFAESSKQDIFFLKEVNRTPNAKHLTEKSNFFESSFDYEGHLDANAKSFCFRGNVKKVCDSLRKTASLKQKKYESGEEHDSMEVYLCKVKGPNVYTRYRLVDDYDGNLLISRTLRPCKN